MSSRNPAMFPPTNRHVEPWVTTTIRFRQGALKLLKKAAIDRNQSIQELIEQALTHELARTGHQIDGLRGAK